MAEPLEALLKRKPNPKWTTKLIVEGDWTQKQILRPGWSDEKILQRTVVEKRKGPRNTGKTTALRGKKCGIKLEGRRERGCRKPKLQGGEGNGKEGWYLISYKEEDGKLVT